MTWSDNCPAHRLSCVCVVFSRSIGCLEHWTIGYLAQTAAHGTNGADQG